MYSVYLDDDQDSEVEFKTYREAYEYGVAESYKGALEVDIWKGDKRVAHWDND